MHQTAECTEGGHPTHHFRWEDAARSSSAGCVDWGGWGLVLRLLKQLAKYMFSSFCHLGPHHHAHFKEGESEKRDFISAPSLDCLWGQGWGTLLASGGSTPSPDPFSSASTKNCQGSCSTLVQGHDHGQRGWQPAYSTQACLGQNSTPHPLHSPWASLWTGMWGCPKEERRPGWFKGKRSMSSLRLTGNHKLGRKMRRRGKQLHGD